MNKKFEIESFIRNLLGLLTLLMTGCQDPPGFHDLPPPTTPTSESTTLVHSPGDSIVTVVTTFNTSDSADRRTLPSIQEKANPDHILIFVRNTKIGQEVVTRFTRHPITIWLNSCSGMEIRNPFDSANRFVSVGGECLIKIGRVAGTLTIRLPDSSTCALQDGEVFISAYPEDSCPTVTFMQGRKLSITTKTRNHSLSLAPGQAVAIHGAGVSFRPVKQDTSALRDLTAQNIFSGTADMASIFHRISRRYGVSVVYRGQDTYHSVGNQLMTGIMDANKPLNVTLQFINNAMRDYLDCRLRNDTVFVTARR